MDQNLMRADLLPVSTAPWIIAVLALLGVATWILCHRALEKYAADKINVWWRALLGVLPGTIGCWLVLQFIARHMFLAAPWSLFTAAVVLAVSIEAVSAFYRHECARVPPGIARCLVACRMAAVSIALFVLMQPVVVGERESAEKKRVLVLIDDSASMHFKDVLMTPDGQKNIAAALGVEKLPDEGLTRAEMIRELLEADRTSGFLAKAARKYHVDVFRFGSGLKRGEPLRCAKAPDAKEETFRSVTDITKALELAIKEVPAEEVAGVIVFTDGRHNGEAGVESVARKFGVCSIPVSSVLIGGTLKPFDLSVSHAHAPESVFLGDRIRFTVRVRATRANGRKAKISFEGAKGPIDSKEFIVEGDDWSKEFKFTDVPKEQGVYSYKLEVENLEGELFAANNVRRLDVAVSADRTNVLLVDGRPRWEYRYLRNLFYGRDKSVHLQDWLVRPDTVAGIVPKRLENASAARPFGRSEAGGWPVSDDEWRRFDVIIVGDVGEDVLTADVIEKIRYNVEERGALLVLVSGPRYMPCAITDRKLRDLMPVEYEPSVPGRRVPGEEAYEFRLTAGGRGHDVMNLSSSTSENDDIWGSLPFFDWRVPLRGVKTGADVLAYARPKTASGLSDASHAAHSVAATIEDDPRAVMKQLARLRGEQNRNALVVAAQRGKGRVLMLMTDSMWRLRSKDGDRHHHRFWGQVMRWGAGERMRSGNQYVRLGTDRLCYGAGETVRVYARFLDEKHAGIENLNPGITVRDSASGTTSAFDLKRKPDSNGVYECEIPGCTSPGTYTVRLDCPGVSRKPGVKCPKDVSTDFVVVTTKNPAEGVDITAIRDHVKRVADATGGRVLTPAEYVGLDADFGGGAGRTVGRVETPLWCMPALFVSIVLLLTAEWILRKRSSLA